MHPVAFNNTLYKKPDTANSQEGLSSETVIVELIEGVLELCVLHAWATERPSYPSCPPLLCLLNQMVPSFLAVPGCLTLQPTAAQDPEPLKWFITQRERERQTYRQTERESTQL